MIGRLVALRSVTACGGLLLLGGCTAPDMGPPTGAEDGSVEEPGSAGAQDNPEEDPTDAEEGPPSDLSVPDGPHGPDGDVPACGDDALAAIDATIGGQLTAFSADDYVGALDFSTERFRAAIDADGFAELIEGGFPVAADADGHELGPCVQPTATTAEVLVEVVDSTGDTGDLVYRMVDEVGGWRIDGAIPVDRRGPGDDASVVTAATRS